MECFLNNTKVFIDENYEELSLRSAQIIKNQVDAVPGTVLGLATGSTLIGTYDELVRLHKAGEVDFSKVVSFNLDEYFPIKKSDNQSYYYYMKKHLFNHVNILAENTHIPDSEAADYEAECAAYEEKITAHGGIDLQILGIGNNGHIGFNEPGDAFISQAHYVKLDESTIKANSRFFDNENDVPKHAITVGMRTIMTAKKILLLASGEKKAEAIFQTIHGAITPRVPASILQLHPNVTIIADKEAARLLL